MPRPARNRPARRRRSRWPSSPACDSTKPMGADCSSSRCAMRLAVRARIGTPFSAPQREAGIEQHGGIAPETFIASVLAGELGQQRSTTCAASMCAAGDTGLGGHGEQARGPRILALVQRMAVARDRPLARRAHLADDARARPLRGRRCERARRHRPAAAAASAEPRITEPQPRIPAATAPCSASGAAASVMRLACTLGTRPCSAMATSVASSTRRCAAVGMLRR